MCHGTLPAFREISSAQKWLRVHNIQEWIDLADGERIADLQRFFDRFLKGIDNGWEDTPRVRLSVLDPGGTDPLSSEAVDAEAVTEYAGDDLSASVTFTTTFEHDVEITGYLQVGQRPGGACSARCRVVRRGGAGQAGATMAHQIRFRARRG